MRRMMSQKQIDYVNDLSEVAEKGLQDGESTLDVKNLRVLIRQTPYQKFFATLCGKAGLLDINSGMRANSLTILDTEGDEKVGSLAVMSINASNTDTETFTIGNLGGDPSEPLIIVEEGEGYIKMPALPTLDPKVEGALWNDNGVLKISAGV